MALALGAALAGNGCGGTDPPVLLVAPDEAGWLGLHWDVSLGRSYEQDFRLERRGAGDIELTMAVIEVYDFKGARLETTARRSAPRSGQNGRARRSAARRARHR